MAAKLGLVGAYLVTKVSLTLDIVGDKYSTQMETMFESSGLDGLIKKEENGEDEDPTSKTKQKSESGTKADSKTKSEPGKKEEKKEEKVEEAKGEEKEEEKKKKEGTDEDIINGSKVDTI